MSALSRLTLAVLVALTAWAHWTLTWQGPVADIVAGAGGGFVLEAILGSPRVVVQLALQVAAALALYALFFAWVAWLARARSAAHPLLRSGPLLLGLNFFASSWLLLRLHNQLFFQSSWSHVPHPEAGSAAMLALDLGAAAWLWWRLALTLAAQLRRHSQTLNRALIALAATAALATVAIFALRYRPFTAPTPMPATQARPDIVLIGLDSLRRDLLLDARPDTLPALAGFRDAAFVQAGVVSTLARTYPSWVSLLTGRPVRETGARENHAPHEGVDHASSLAWTLKRAGYHTVFATDDTQFSALGEDFGFDDIRAPQPGVPNFVLTRFADIPLVNLALQIPGAEALWPALAANRAFSHAYRPERFVARVRAAVRAHPPTRSHEPPRKPLFLAMHLCALHWPFYFADENDGLGYSAAVKVLDRQLGQMLSMLRAEGIDPANAIFVLLADHGDSGDEARAAPTVIGHGTPRSPGTAVRGHGTTVLDPTQWRSFAMFQGHAAQGRIPPGRSGQLAGLDDIAPTLLALAGLPEADREVLDVAMRLPAQGAPARAGTRRIVPLETGLRSGGLDLGNPDPGEALRLARTRYCILPDGQPEMTAAGYAEALSTKDLGVTDDRTALVALWTPEGPLLVSADLSAQRWDVYPAEKPPGTAPPPLLDAACADAEIRARLPGWCAPPQVSPDAAKRP